MTAAATLRDARGRHMRYLRVSLTDRCNFRCRYCMPTEGIRKLQHEDMLSLEELAELIRVLVEDLGIEKVRVTGGEPLVRRGVVGFLRAVGRIPGIRDFALTTNAFFLADLAADIRMSGVARLNISLDTLQRDRFRRFTRVDGLPQVLRGIEAARRAGFFPIKLNTVIMRDNLDELPDILAFAIENDLQARFIELMPSQEGDGRQVTQDGGPPPCTNTSQLIPNGDRPARASDDQFVPAALALETLGRRFSLQLNNLAAFDQANGVAALYQVNNTSHLCGFITPITCPFCHSCDRIRLRGDGQLMPCLSEAEHFDLKPYLRPSLRREELTGFVRRSLGASKSEMPHERRIQGMWRIGG